MTISLHEQILLFVLYPYLCCAKKQYTVGLSENVVEKIISINGMLDTLWESKMTIENPPTIRNPLVNVYITMENHHVKNG